MEILALNQHTVALRRTKEWLTNVGNVYGLGIGTVLVADESYPPEAQKKAQYQKARCWILRESLSTFDGPRRMRLCEFDDFATVQFLTTRPFSCTTWSRKIRTTKGLKVFPDFDRRFNIALSLAQNNRSWWKRRFPDQSRDFCAGKMNVKNVIYMIFFHEESDDFPTGTQVYVGLTKQSFKDRMNQHCSGTQGLCDIMLHTVDPRKVVFLILDMALSVNELRNLESRYIQMFRSFGPAGFNMISGSRKK